MDEREGNFEFSFSEKIKISEKNKKNEDQCIKLYIQKNLIFLLNKVTADTICIPINVGIFRVR